MEAFTNREADLPRWRAQLPALNLFGDQAIGGEGVGNAEQGFRQTHQGYTPSALDKAKLKQECIQCAAAVFVGAAMWLPALSGVGQNTARGSALERGLLCSN